MLFTGNNLSEKEVASKSLSRKCTVLLLEGMTTIRGVYIIYLMSSRV